ncbi:Transmembrane protein TauE-like [Parasponia andersonii]|uniref:Transmembrane protein TauE-like n=1 Tax=Parasponia andersonii TaxID=3476 RepID=A0A2P5D4S6_PARAD|nr:Transmembrane protein TauE-like [Parasponia andersonii]
MKFMGIALIGFLVLASTCIRTEGVESSDVTRTVSNNSSQPASQSGYRRVWPEMRFGWKIVVGGVIGFFGAAFGSVGGAGGGGFFLPMLNLVIGFDPKSATALSKCMIVSGAASTVFYNLRQRHPTLELPIIDYDLALLFQPMLILGISIGVTLNVLFAEWMITLLLIIMLTGTSTKSFHKGIQVWKKETTLKKETARRIQPNGESSAVEEMESKRTQVSIFKNIYPKELGLLIVVWIVVVAIQIIKNYTKTCSVLYWLLNFLQIPVTIGVTLYESISLYKGRRVIASKGEVITNYPAKRLITYSVLGIVAGTIAGLLGIGGGFILGPIFLELGIPIEVTSATATFIMLFSSSISIVEYYLLKRFPVPYALYFAIVAIVSAILGQTVLGKVIRSSGRTSIIIFILASMMFVGAISLGGVGIAHTIEKIEHHEYMGFENICK